MKIKAIGRIVKGQDGAIFHGLLFRFTTGGNCYVYDLGGFTGGDEAEPMATFRLDQADRLAPHSNSVMFGNEYYCTGDEFPLLYSNIYNNYAKAENKRKGVTCVYRIQRNGSEFTSKLVQLIEIGFVEDAALWRSAEGTDVRPYGNFAIDTEKSLYYAFTMLDGTRTTRYFRFALPKGKEGTWDEAFGVNRVVLMPEDIQDQFDCGYHHFIQGASCHKGKIYSLEGFTDSKHGAAPALRIIDPDGKCQQAYIPFGDYGMTLEPELIDFWNGICYYCDNHGNLYAIDFEAEY